MTRTVNLVMLLIRMTKKAVVMMTGRDGKSQEETVQMSIGSGRDDDQMTLRNQEQSMKRDKLSLSTNK